MSKRKYSIENITPAQLDEINALYPKAVQVVIKPVYKVIAMLMECGLEVPGVTSLSDDPPLIKKMREKTP